MNVKRARTRIEEELARLQESRESLVAESSQGGAGLEGAAELSSIDQHPADHGSEVFEREKNLSIIESLEEEIGDARAALRRIEEGTYEKCEIDGGDIGEERLKAMPTARYCLRHQEEIEKDLRPGLTDA
ncbi:MAG: TraR/DksA C4-type zinc finger protein [Actinobacteria bacterium]|nr:TraR/DksA C4-type zinc finger protein [Actinomycetota bacterium]